MHPLDGCRAKLDWAEKHLDALSAEMKTAMEGESHTFRTEFDEADQSTVAYFKEPQQLPVEWGLAMGDVIHNTRSALDHLVYQLVLLAGATPHNVHQFPIVDAPHEWKRRVETPPKNRLGLLDFVDSAHVASIKSLQPYVPTTGLPRLAVLRDFDNIDKHRLIHTARTTFAGTPDITAKTAIPSTITDVRALPPGAPIEDDAEVLRFRGHTDFVFGSAQVRRGTPPGIWTPGQPLELLDVRDWPENAEMNVDIKLPMTSVFGAPGVAYTRGREFRHAISDVRGIVASFDSAFPT